MTEGSGEHRDRARRSLADAIDELGISLRHYHRIERARVQPPDTHSVDSGLPVDTIRS